ncbi:serine carboxypeptidase [Pochonia chlamydosporia 170]|uniref:Carboxypeptidase n=1 Tax=Pochonia chlamydosporia 170 TaxID=1380566 RepID=A0A179FML0_METCM|nr:serine carboxypeptidase [Pochonia chlamydosporia 170]OAQ66577.1 serine carboxypeptidase [Pochonia chlamydosporia 170]
MRTLWMVSLLGFLSSTTNARKSDNYARLLQHLHGDGAAEFSKYSEAKTPPTLYSRAKTEAPHRFLNNGTQKFAVNGTGIPEVDFDIGESYAGLLPVTDKKEDRDNLFFWFFPTDNEEHKKKKEITIWLNGGPGCSSLLGLLQENGPFVWQPGTLKPVPNPWSWHHLTNVVWIEQPVTVGFSTGNTTIHNEDELAKQFMGFWKNFIDTFCLQGYKVYVVGESYGGYYAPYIASHFVNANDTDYYDVGGLMVVDGISFDGDVQSEVVVETFVEQNYNLMPFDDRFMATIHNTSEHCGYRDFIKKYYVYPPAGEQPSLLPWQEKLPNGTVTYKEGCGGLWDAVNRQAKKDNPCFNIYNILDHCPDLYDPLGDDPYFNREDVKKAIHAPLQVQWSQCVNTAFVNRDESLPPSKYELPNVIDKTKNVIYVQGGTDFILPANGVLLALQNMTWGGKMGFQSRPTDPFYVPRFRTGKQGYGSDLPDKSGVVGTSHHERGLSVAVTGLSGHEGPEYASTSAFRQLEKLLGRVHSLSDTTPFTLPQLKNATQDEKPLGKGTFPIPWVYSG